METDLIIHYFLKDSTLHQLNARLVNTNQANIISIIEMISQELGIEIDIDVLAAKEGGLKDILNIKITKRDIFVGTGSAVVAILVNVISNFLTQDTELNTLQKEYYKTQIEQAKLNSQVCEKTSKELEKLKQRIDDLETSETVLKIKRKRSVIYTQMNDNTQITSFAIEESTTNEEIKTLGKVDKKDFCKFIDEQKRVLYVDEDATIEIISPVLNNSKYKWRGNYQNEVIEFSMKDKEFKNKILSEDLQFGSNNILSAKLEIRKDIDEYGNEKISSYAVLEVFGTELKDGYIEMPRTTRRRTMQNQMDLFSLDDLK